MTTSEPSPSPSLRQPKAALLRYFIISSLISANSFAASSETTGDIISEHIASDYVQVVTGTGASSLSLQDFTTVSVELKPDGSATGPITHTLTLSGSTTIDNPDYSGVIMYASTPNRDAIANIGSEVTIVSGSGFGGIWVRNETSGNISVTSGATITANGPTGYSGANDGINAVTNLGSAQIVNTGTVFSTSRGLYAEGSGGPSPVLVSINNSGNVNSTAAGARAINYNGLASVTNSGDIHSTERQAVVAWSASGDASITNSGTAVADDYTSLVAGASIGDITIINSGKVSANQVTVSGNSGNGYFGIQGYVGTFGDITITNTETGIVDAGDDVGIAAMTPEGNVKIINDGSIQALYGVQISSGNGSGVTATGNKAFTDATSDTVDGIATLLNRGSIIGQDLGVYLDATTNQIENSGLISSIGGGAIQTINGDTTILNTGTISSLGGSGVAIAMGSGSNRLIINESSLITGTVTSAGSNTVLELTGSNTGTFDIDSIGSTAQYQGFSSIEKTGAGIWILNGNSTTYSGEVSIKAGTLRIGNSMTLPGSLNNASVLDLQTNVLTVGGDLTGNGAIQLTINKKAHGYLINDATGSDLSKARFAINPGSKAKLNQTLVLAAGYKGKAPSNATTTLGYRLYRIVKAENGGTDSQGNAYGKGSLVLTNAPYSFKRNPVPANAAALVVRDYLGQNPALGNLSLAVQSITKFSDLNKAGAQLRPEANGGTLAPAQITTAQTLQTITLRNEMIRTIEARGDALQIAGYASSGDGKAPTSLVKPTENGFDLWAQSFYSNAAQGERDGVDGYFANTTGFAIGTDAAAWESVRLGAAFSYASTDVNDRGTRSGSGQNANSYLGSLYASYYGAPWYIDGTLFGGVHQFQSGRQIDFGSYREKANARFASQQYGAKLEGGYPIAFKSVLFTPVAALGYSYLKQGSYTETGAPGANLHVNSAEYNSLRSNLGARLSTTIATKSGWYIIPELRAFWYHEFADTNLDQTSQFVAAGGSAFTTPGVGLPRDGVNLGASLGVISSHRVDANLRYDAEVAEDYIRHTFVLEARFKF